MIELMGDIIVLAVIYAKINITVFHLRTINQFSETCLFTTIGYVKITANNNNIKNTTAIHKHINFMIKCMCVCI